MDTPTKFNLQEAPFNFFVSHEGNNLSDNIESHIKLALHQAML